MMIFLDDFCRTNADHSEEFNQQKLDSTLLEMQLSIRPYADVYRTQALSAHRILDKYRR